MYARHLYDDGTVSVRFISSKSNVAPLESTSIPRLELMAAVLGVRLAKRVCKALEIEMAHAVFWSDSMNVLYWIRNQSRQFKPFVANRIGEIHQDTCPSQWRKIAGVDNPADYVSRGMTVKTLASCEKWWEGPQFLKDDECEWPISRVETPTDSTVERKRSATAVFHTDVGENATDPWSLNPERFSNWNRLVHVNAWVHRFIENSRTEKQSRRHGPLKPQEIQDSKVHLIGNSQRSSFPAEFSALKRKQDLPKNSKLLPFTPRLDSEGLLRSDSRLGSAYMLSYDCRHPIILPRNCALTKLIVKHYHESTNHGGTNQTLCKLSAQFCIVAAREEIRSWERICAECKRRKVKPMNQIMAPLPAIRTQTPLRAFAHTAVDYGGPFITMQGRGKRREKRYLCVFTCLATRAVHLEMTFGLDTNSFLNAFYRMVNRRGLPLKMLSDNAQNFVGANKELKELVNKLDRDQIVRTTADRGIEWQFNPPLAPHWGGAHEIMIKAAKRAIYGILRDADVNDEELMSAFTGAEALLNSRPLTYQSAHSSDVVPLTPNHFLVGVAGGEFAPQSTDYTAYNPLRRWRRVQELTRHFWQRWMKEWLPTLGPRRKWLATSRDLAVDGVVIVVSTDTARESWPLGRVVEVYTGADGHVRSAKVIVSGKTITRPITKLCPLEKNE